MGKSNLEVFKHIYETNKWGNKESRSGAGSTLRNSKSVREFLEKIANPKLCVEILGEEVHNILDAPCGDFHWMKEVNLRELEYYGVDIVPEIIQSCQTLYTSESPLRSFFTLDICSDQLARPYDLIFCRDCLIHLPINDIKATLSNFKSSQSKFFVTTFYNGVSGNHNTRRGGWNAINLEEFPFNFPSPIFQFQDNNTPTHRKCMGIWDLRKLELTW